MKRYRFLYLIISIGLLALIVGFYSTVLAQRAKNLYNFATAAKEVNVHIGNFRSFDKAKEIGAEDVIKAFELRLKNRKTITFNVVERIEDADLSISGDIIGFTYLKKDPVDIFIPIGLIIDLATSKKYARLEYEISVLDPKKKKVVWKRYLKATITESDMTKEESIPLIIDRAAYVFIKECFGKPKSRQKI